MWDKQTASFAVAIDGPSASGKSTVARALARALGCLYVDSGSFYRALTWKALKEGIDPADAPSVRRLLERMEWHSLVRDGHAFFLIDGEDPSPHLRSAAVTEAVSDLSAIPEVRAFVGERLRAVLEQGSLVMEGRDIGTVVFADSPWKFYLDADPAERARRRRLEFEQEAGPVDEASVGEALRRRDRKDSSRAAAPLQVAPGAEVIDSTGLSVAETVETILDALRRRGWAV